MKDDPVSGVELAGPVSARADRDRSPWLLDPSVVFLNHASFGACPGPVLEAQRWWRDRLETDPVRFLARELEDHLDAARSALARFVGTDPAALAFVPNATTGVNTVLASRRFRPGDELLATDHEYNATLNALERTAVRDGATVIRAAIPFPIHDPDEAVAAVLGAVSPRTRFALLSHVTSPTALVLPVERLVAELERQGIETMVDGAHAPGMVPLALDALGASYYTGNGHKWLCAPKGAAFLHVRADRRAAIRPLAVSHGANDPRTDRPRFRLEFDWTGTDDPTPYLAIPDAIAFLASLRRGGRPGRMAAARALAIAARDRVASVLGIGASAPDSMLGAMAALPLPIDPGDVDGASRLAAALATEDRIEVPIIDWPVRAARDPGAPPRRWLIRVSAGPYNDLEDVEVLAAALERRLADQMVGPLDGRGG